MSIFLDTSGFLAVLDADDENHTKAKDAWVKILSSDETLITSNYVLVETFALVQNRLSMEVVRVFQDDIIPVVHITWVDEITHKMGISVLLAASRRRLSLVDCVSFETMRQPGLKIAFSFDSHFKEQGFKCIP